MASGSKEYDLQSIRYKVFILFTTVPTIKGAGSASGMSRYEWEKEISVAVTAGITNFMTLKIHAE